ncbi:MAG: hypothetical protein ACE1ZQ_09625 [Ignavibacteriaceae bacterium]
MKRLLCKIGFHEWEISKWVIFKDKKCKHIKEEGFDRECERCGKEQILKRPIEYHPSKYIWTDFNNTLKRYNNE